MRTIVLLGMLVLMAGCARATPIPPEVGEALLMDAAAYAADQGIPVEEAVRRLSLQPLIGDLQARLSEDEAGVFGGLWIQHEPEYRVVVQVTRGERRIFRRYVEGSVLEDVVAMRTVGATLAELENAQAATMKLLREAGSAADTGLNVQENCVAVYVADEAALNAKLATAGASLSDTVCVVPVGPYAQAPALDVPAGVAFPRQDPPEGMFAEMMALLIGRLTEEDGCLRVGADEGSGVLVIWPYDHTVTLEADGKIAIRDGSGTVVARMGDLVRMGGGESSSIQSESVRAGLGSCEGPYWFAARGIEGMSLESLLEDPDIAPVLEDLEAAGEVLGAPEDSRAAFLYPEPGIMVTIGGNAWLHMHRFPSEQVAEVRAASIVQDARNAIIDWVAPPSFYRCGRVIALYLGRDAGAKDVLVSRCTLFFEP
ncbi:MAG: hypothetical protein MUF84_20710 [Anaerolineae bacterium]|nr:hypothetical protein [Anaerolineae bacterium]